MLFYECYDHVAVVRHGVKISDRI